MSIANAITDLTNTIRNLAITKQEIKSAVNYDIETIGNEQIEAYPELIRRNQETLKQYIPTTKEEGKQLSLITAPLKPKEFAFIGDKFQKTYKGKNLYNEKSDWNINASMYTTGANSRRFPYTFGGNRYTYFYKCKPNTSYTISNKTPGDRLMICEHYSEFNPLDYESFENSIVLDNMIVYLSNNIPNSYTFVTGANAKMVAIYYSLNTIPTEFQIEENTEATDYEQYVGGVPSPNPEYPQSIQVVTEEQTVHIGNTTKMLDLGNIELVKIKDYADVLFKNKNGSKYYNSELEENTWYKYKIINKLILDGSEDWQISGTTYSLPLNPLARQYENQGEFTENNFALSDKFIWQNGRQNTFVYGSMWYITAGTTLRLQYDYPQNLQNFKNWLSNNNLILYYVLQTPIYEKITDAELISQLEAINNTKMNDGTTIIYAEQKEEIQSSLYIETYTRQETRLNEI